MVPKSDHLANPRFDKKPSVQVAGKARVRDLLCPRSSVRADRAFLTAGGTAESVADSQPVYY